MAGAYEIREAHGLDLWAEGLAQGLKVSLPGLQVMTPIGPIDVLPEFRFGRATGFITSPFDGNVKSSFPDAGLGVTKNQTVSIYGLGDGTNASTKKSVKTSSGGTFISYDAQAWSSLISLGSRDSNPKNPPWKPAAGVEYPVRPDLDPSVARSAIEKTPNAYLGASIEASYDIKNILPKVLLDVGCSGFVKICIDTARVFARPTIDIGFTSQIQFLQNEQVKWNHQIHAPTGKPFLFPANFDQAKKSIVLSSASTAARFAIDAGLDLDIWLRINGVFTKINKHIVNIHPRATVAEKIDKAMSTPKTVEARSQASSIMKDKKLFQNYTLWSGINLASGATDGGAKHIKTCLASPSASQPMPPAPTYTPGDTTKLAETLEYPCNICVGWEDTAYIDDDNKPQIAKGQLGVIFPASQSGFSSSDQWICKHPAQSGCYDMCKVNADSSLTVVKTAVQLIKSGNSGTMPKTCGRF